jgi:hypothetical protein
MLFELSEEVLSNLLIENLDIYVLLDKIELFSGKNKPN